MLKSTMRSLTILSLCVSGLSGCVAGGNMLAGDTYRRVDVPDANASFRQVLAVENDGQLKVSGRLRATTPSTYLQPKQVEVTLIDPSGTRLDSRRIAASPKVLPGHKHHREERFSTTFDQVPPPGTTIQLAITE
ncbi:MAG: hypothetical protein AB1568_12815 [Thermodesulfobacteriota bacterium]